MRTPILATIATLLAAPAAASERPANAPEFLLADLGVRVDLPGSWKMTRWSDWDFKGETQDGTVLVLVWATPLQVPVTDAAPWGAAYTAKVAEMKATEPTVRATRIEEIGGRKAAFVDAEFRFAGGGDKGVLYGATFEIAGQDLHLATITGRARAGLAERSRADLARRLDFQGPGPASTYGATVEATGTTTKLPDDWRPLLDAEWNHVTGTLGKLGLEDVTGCWTAIRPRAMAAPDLMVTCPRNVQLGVVDEHSFETADQAVRDKLFGKSVPPATLVEVGDRVGFLYVPRDGLAFGAVPNARGVAVTWAIGEGPLGDAVRQAMQASTQSGPHPVETGEKISYWLTERTFSPQVLCPALCCLGGVGMVVVLAAGVILLRGRRRPTEEDEP